jgi:L,D-transpeptidase catalytic domain
MWVVQESRRAHPAPAAVFAAILLAVNGLARALTVVSARQARWRRVARTGALLAAVVAAASPALAAAQTSGAAVPGPTVSDPLAGLVNPGDVVRLSDEKLVTRWAHANELWPIRTAPRKTAHAITRLRFFTEDKRPEVYLVLSGIVDASGDAWLRVRIPRRPNGEKGWVPLDMLSQLHAVRTQLVINRTTLRATLYKAGRRIWQAPVGVGKASTPTPAGKFYVRELLRGDRKLYGTWAFGTSAYASISDWPNGGVVGVHGTNQPGLIPGRPSHGCVRLRNININRLRLIMPIGTPIEIR